MPEKTFTVLKELSLPSEDRHIRYGDHTPSDERGAQSAERCDFAPIWTFYRCGLAIAHT